MLKCPSVSAPGDSPTRILELLKLGGVTCARVLGLVCGGGGQVCKIGCGGMGFSRLSPV